MRSGRLDAAGVAESRLKAELILSRALNCHRLELPLQQNRELSAARLNEIAARVRRVIAGEPIQYVLGDMDFMGRVFKTDSRALIPRPETETLVENVLACEDVWSSQHPAVADVGAGTGCIIVTLALERPMANTWPSIPARARSNWRERMRRLWALKRR